MSGADVDVMPATAAHLQALIDGPDRFEALFGRVVVPGYLGFDGVLEYSLDAITTGGVPAEWSTYLFVEQGAHGRLIGIGGFKGAPDAGVVEIGYEIAPALRGRGCATAAATALIDVARGAGCDLVIAHTLAERNPSTSVLTRLGFAHTATIDDPEDGPVWRWELPISGPDSLGG